MRRFCIILSVTLLCFGSSCNLSDSEKSFIRKGNKQYKKEKFEEAEIQYRKAIDKAPNTFDGKFNLSDATYKQNKFEETRQLIKQLTENEKDKKRLGMLFHNQGNTFLMTQKIDEAIEAYKNSLRNNPTDKETKYNLEYARHLKKKQQNQQKQDKSKQQKDQSEKDKNKNKSQSEQDKQQNQPQEQDRQGISKENAERMLDAVLIDEKKIKEKMEKEKAKKQRVNTKNQKDW